MIIARFNIRFIDSLSNNINTIRLIISKIVMKMWDTR